MSRIRVLAIETSFDDTAVAIVDCSRKIWADAVVRQHSIHERFRGVVPSLASHTHRVRLPIILQDVLFRANLSITDIDAIAVTRGPGIAGCLSAGLEAARTLAATLNKPFYPIHHMVVYLSVKFIGRSCVDAALSIS